MAIRYGASGTGNVNADIKKPDIGALYLLEPDAAPLTQISLRLNASASGNTKYEWFEKGPRPRFDAVNTTTGTGAAIIVDNPSYFAEHDIWRVTRTGENMRVQSVNTASSTVTFVRGVGGSAVAVADNDELLRIGVAKEEGSTSKVASAEDATKLFNYVQIFEQTVQMTGTMSASATWTPNKWREDVEYQGVEFKKDCEYSYLLGKPSEVTTGEHPRHTTGGALNYITTNVTDAGGALTEAEWWGIFGNAFRYGSKTKVAFASRLAVDVLNSYPRGRLDLVQSDNDETYGLNVMRYRHPHGELAVVTHNLLEGAVYGGYIVILDFANANIKRRYLSANGVSRDVQFNDNIQAPDYDGRKAQWLAEQGLEFGQEKKHAYVKGITG